MLCPGNLYHFLLGGRGFSAGAKRQSQKASIAEATYTFEIYLRDWTLAGF
jgi:hypothetical protein